MDKLLTLKIPGVGGTSEEITAPTGVPTDISLGTIISFGINFLFVIGVVLALFFLMWGGISWITSGGDAEKLEKARKTLVYAIVGLVVIAISYAIITLIGNMLGIEYFGFHLSHNVDDPCRGVPPGQPC